MKALIAAGGRATRLRPITWTINKHLIPLAGRPMLAHVIEKIVEAGITDIYVNVNPGEGESMRAALGDGSAFGAKLTYLEQQGGAKGVAHVVANAEAQLKGERFLFFLGDNIILGSIKRFVERFEAEKLDCMLAFSRVKDPQRFGVPEFDAAGKLVRVVEKPANPPSPFAVTGIYLYDTRFFDAFRTIAPSVFTSCATPVELSLAWTNTALAGSRFSRCSIAAGSTAWPHSTLTSSTFRPYAWHIFTHRSPNFPPLIAMTRSPGDSTFAIALSIPPVPLEARIMTS